jgi:hypothetical protein
MAFMPLSQELHQVALPCNSFILIPGQSSTPFGFILIKNGQFVITAHNPDKILIPQPSYGWRISLKKSVISL